MVQPVYGGLVPDHERSLAPGPLNQTNTKLEMPEHDSKNYTLQLVYSLPGTWEAAACCLLSGTLQMCGFAALAFISLSSSCLLYTQLLCFHCLCERLEAVQPLLCWHNISNAGIWGEFVSV